MQEGAVTSHHQITMQMPPIFTPMPVAPQENVVPIAATEWRTKEEIAQYYRCNVRTVTNLMRRRILPFVKIGHLVRFDVAACDSAMRRYQRKSAV
jgi:excisionase family DNA binding protein